MDHHEVGQLWESNAEAWTVMTRAGYDVTRIHLNTPAFLEMLPDVAGLYGLDIGCGEGANTRTLADLGARMTAIDIAPTFIHHAEQAERDQPRGIRYLTASAIEMPLPDETFDFATGFMSFMDIPETDRLLAEAHRVLRPGGFLQFSILHPCFMTVAGDWITDEQGRRIGKVCGAYFDQPEGEVEQWSFSAAPAEVREQWPKFSVPRFPRTLSQWINMLLDAGFRIERTAEPSPDDELIKRLPSFRDERIAPYFLQFRCRRP